MDKLSVKAPDGPTKVKILTEIAEEHNVVWEAQSFVEPDPRDKFLVSNNNNMSVVLMHDCFHLSVNNNNDLLLVCLEWSKLVSVSE